jgi:aubergine
LTFIIVQKRISQKFFKIIPGKTGADALVNPPPGSVLDHTVTSSSLYDFLVVSQYVREGCTTPTRYIVLVDEKGFPPDVLQKLTYKLCFLYYNWPGTVRVPAPCQYAHKFSTLVGESIKKETAKELNDKLFFL